VRIDLSGRALQGEPYCCLTTTGRRTRRSHTIEIWFAAEGRSLYLISGGADRSDWVRNLLAEPAATVRIDDTTFAARARLPLPHGPERDTAVSALHDKYGRQVSGTVESWLADAYIVALDVSPGGQQ
jgi:deazaflavin-dependent oxidoreductase (nitroreductase family)